MCNNISFLGPKGTFTHEAAYILEGNLIPYCTIPAVMESVSNGECQFGVVPIENSIEGPVGLTLDSLAHKFDLKIFKEMVIPINQNLIVNPKTEIQPHYAVSTASAAKSILGDKTKAAIGNSKAAEIYGLEILKPNIQDLDNNETRFVVLSKNDHEPTGRDKTSIIFSIYEDKPGMLYKILGVFEKESINLTKIESRPSKKGLGKYLFFVDFYGHRKDKTVQNILNELDGLT